MRCNSKAVSVIRIVDHQHRQILRLFHSRDNHKGCRAVSTSEKIMQRYLQRSLESMSSKSIPRYFEQVMELHRAKTETFLSLSRTATEEERKSFCARDLGYEMMNTVDRFARYPQEEKENMPPLNALLFSRCPSLREHLLERGIQDPEHWFRSQAGRQVVIDCLRNDRVTMKTVPGQIVRSSPGITNRNKMHFPFSGKVIDQIPVSSITCRQAGRKKIL